MFGGSWKWGVKREGEGAVCNTTVEMMSGKM